MCSFFYIHSLSVFVSVSVTVCVFFLLLRFMIQVLLLGHSWNATDKLLVFRCRCQMQVNRRNAGRTGKWTLCRNFHISADLSSCHALEINRNTCVCAYAFASPPSWKKKHQKGITERPNQKHTENKTGWINRASRTNICWLHIVRWYVRSFVSRLMINDDDM